MAIPTLSSADFRGSIGLSTDNFGSLDYYINEFYSNADSEGNYIRDFVGEEALQEIKISSLQKWADLMEGVTYLNSDGIKARFSGVKEMCKNAIFFEYVRDDYTPANTGFVQNMNENGMRLDSQKVYQKSARKFNQSVKINNEQLLCFLETYENYQEQITGTIDNGGGSWTIQTDSTLYLSDGETVKINGVDYIISNVVENVSFDITSLETYFPDTYSYSPFESVLFTYKDYIVI
jgi:hypothetical protein